ncbi:hypothetical protein E2C01_045247 [Portunus trituberculatus]|uniref:Uncharacterized protein n=1 Tax=Portunus trituberculatus TaxID=210409 RepID=A0A5B7G2B6_PORTR|nr:hypothetical protein [Portunus trituberculatus]
MSDLPIPFPCPPRTLASYRVSWEQFGVRIPDLLSFFSPYWTKISPRGLGGAAAWVTKHYCEGSAGSGEGSPACVRTKDTGWVRVSG